MKQISVFVENQVGSLAHVTGLLKKANINIKAIASFDSPAYGILRLIVDDPEQAEAVLHDGHCAVKTTQVMAVELQDHPGSLDHLLSVLAEAGIDVRYVYSFVFRQKQEPLMVLNVSDFEKAAVVLKEADIGVVEL